MLKGFIYNRFFLFIVKFISFIFWKLGNYLHRCRIKNDFPLAGKNLVFDKTTAFKYKENIKIGENVSIGPGVSIGAKSCVVLGDFVRISQNVIIETAGCDLDTEIPYKHKSAPIVIEDNVWLGSNSIILGGVTIGRNSVVGAGAIVFKNVPRNSIVFPPKSTHVINRRFKNEC